jgi:glycosyltransferase involved in cell wall biosynthesis
MNSHICHIVNHLDTGGAEQYVVQLSNHLHSSGRRVSIIAGEPQVLRDRLEPGVHVETVALHPGAKRSLLNYIKNLFLGCKHLVNYFRRENVTVVHTHLAASAVPAWIAAKLCGIPVIHSRMYAGNSGSRLEHVLFSTRLPLLLVSRFLVFTRYSEKEVRQQWHVPAEKIVVSSIGVDMSRFFNDTTRAAASRKELGLSGEERVLLVVARLHSEKDVELAIRAARTLDDASTLLLIVGDGQERERLESLVKELPGRTRIRFLGLLKDPRPAFAAADLLLQTTRSPNLGTVVLEAMASSLPVVIAYRDEDEYLMAVDTFEGTDIGVIAEATPKTLAEAVATLCIDEARMKDLRARVRAFVETRHARHMVYSALADVYTGLECHSRHRDPI